MAGAIPGAPPDLVNPPAGCYFHPRCPRVMAECRERYPSLTQLTATHAVNCHLYKPTPAPGAIKTLS